MGTCWATGSWGAGSWVDGSWAEGKVLARKRGGSWLWWVLKRMR